MRGHDHGPLEGERGLSIQGAGNRVPQKGGQQQAQRQKAWETGWGPVRQNHGSRGLGLRGTVGPGSSTAMCVQSG